MATSTINPVEKGWTNIGAFLLGESATIPSSTEEILVRMSINYFAYSPFFRVKIANVSLNSDITLPYSFSNWMANEEFTWTPSTRTFQYLAETTLAGTKSSGWTVRAQIYYR